MRTIDDDKAAFPALDPDALAFLESFGEKRPVTAGEYLYREGDQAYDFYVVVSGVVEIVAPTDDGEQIVTRHAAGNFLGELNLLTGQRVFVSARVVEPGEVIVVPQAEFQRLIATRPVLGNTILAAFIARRSFLLSDAPVGVRLVGSRFSPETMHIREFLARNRIPHAWLDPDSDVDVEVLLRGFAVDPGDLPVVIVSGEILRRATPGDVSSYLGLTIDAVPDRTFDLVVVGGGPAGLAAAVYGATEGLTTLVVEKVAVGGQAGTSSRIENYLGFPTGISGEELTERAMVQAEKFGARMTSPCAVESLREDAGLLVLGLGDGSDVVGRAVIVASGARYRRLDAERLEDFEDNGVFYACTEMEARLCGGSPVVVVGGGNSAGQAALFLASSGSPVTLLIRGADLGARMSRYLVDRIEDAENIIVRTKTVVVALDGERSMTSVRVASEGREELLPCVGLFSFIGADPAAAWLSGCAALDARGFVLTDRSLTQAHLGETWEALQRDPLPYETNRPGLFAVGDVRSGSTKRVATAVGEGSAAVRSVHEYLSFAH